MWVDLRIYAPCGIAGLVFALCVLGSSMVAQTGQETTLHTFSGGSDGYEPITGLAFDASGNLYGTTYFGGTAGGNCGKGCGTVYQLKAGKSGSWTFKTIHSFVGGTGDLSFPAGRVAFDSAGNLFGTAGYGGTGGYGGLFELAVTTWKESILYNFVFNTGETPAAGMTLYKKVWYGSTQFGPQTHGLDGGTVFSLKQSGSAWKEQAIHTFQTGTDGYEPQVELVFDQLGNIYGTTPYGGTSGSGDIYELAPQSGGTYKETILYSFPNYEPGVSFFPSTMVVDSAGNLYGTAEFGGNSNCQPGCGSVFELQNTKSGWKYVTLYEFTGGKDGVLPAGGLVPDGKGDYYGMTLYGGTGSCVAGQESGCGSVFKLSPVSGGWQKTTVYDFLGAADGEYPQGALVIDSGGNLYGVTAGGLAYGNTGYGTVFKIVP